ncbi:lactose-binding lectin l-2-like [Lepisosteus oculatus]|uniref:lactose-binding lectin l-2-like n=1 Tax=Lepisosteus oculatus TaxID=7918 RepID=UPI00371AA7A2
MIRLPTTVLLCIVFTLSVDSVLGKVCQRCPSGWVSFQDRCFQHFAQAKIWADAEVDCIRYGGNLASVHSEVEHNFLLQLIKSRGANPTWLGGSDCVKEGRWLWSDGSKWDYSKWDPPEPNNLDVENCLLTYWALANWNDMPCNYQFPYICALTP